MRLGFNGATTQTADLATDIRIAGTAGYALIELRDDKLDAFLTSGGALEVAWDHAHSAAQNKAGRS